MNRQVLVFVDSDVVISSLLSSSGAAYLLLHTASLALFISNVSQQELAVVVKRLGLSQEDLSKLESQTLSIITLGSSLHEIKGTYARYVTDLNDAHIVAGAVQAKTKFLITYNLIDYKVEEIKQDFDIVVLTPARFLQYLRSRN